MLQFSNRLATHEAPTAAQQNNIWHPADDVDRSVVDHAARGKAFWCSALIRKAGAFGCH